MKKEPKKIEKPLSSVEKKDKKKTVKDENAHDEPSKEESIPNEDDKDEVPAGTSKEHFFKALPDKIASELDNTS